MARTVHEQSNVSWGDFGDGPPAIDGYVLLRQINAGGAAAVYEGRCIADETPVAIKLLRRDHSSTSYDRFILEAQVGLRLEHPNIVRVRDHGESANALYIVMELLDGEDLSEAMGDPALDFRARLEIVIQVARALHFAHERGVLHRDVKPSNIFLNADGTVRLLDFGISKVTGFDLTRTDVISGTPGYISPEQIQGHTVDRRADLFGLAVVAYELLAGHSPWPRGPIYETMLSVCTRPPDSLMFSLHKSQRFPISPAVQARLYHVIHRALSSEPDRRPGSLAAFADQLEEILELDAENPGAETKNPSGLAISAGTGVSSWANRRLDWAKARAERARSEGAEDIPILEPSPVNFPVVRTARVWDSTVLLWAALVALFAGGTAAVLLRLLQVG